MAGRGRSTSPHPIEDADMDTDTDTRRKENATTKVVIVTNLTRNVVEAHLQTIFGFYGEITKIDVPIFTKSGQNRGKAALEYSSATSAQKAISHMDGGQLDGAVLKVEFSDLPIRSRSRSRPRQKNGRDAPRSPSRSRSPSRTRGLPRRQPPYGGESYRGRGSYGRRGGPVRDTYRPRSRTRSRTRSPIRSLKAPGRGVASGRRSPSYERGGTGGRGRSRSFSVHSSRSRSRSYSRSRSRSARSYSSYSRSRSRSRSSSYSRGRRSHSRDDIRDSRSRSPRSPRNN